MMLRIALFLSLLCVSPLHAEIRDEAKFDVILRGIKAGELHVKGREDDGQYSVAGLLKSTGLVGQFLKISYDAQSTGRLRESRYAPLSYREEAINKDRKRTSMIQYKNGTPVEVTTSPARSSSLEPTAQKGTVDILTALYAALRDQSPEKACSLNMRMFDGRKLTQLKLTRKDPLTCAGEYRRLKGFSAEDMAERVSFPFTMTLTPQGDKLRVIEVRTPTTYGDAILRRR